MAMPNSGSPISFSQMQTEFGGTNPISLSEYYAGGANVPSGTTGTNGAVPASSTIGMSKFYGTSDLPPVSITNRNVSQTSVTTLAVARAGYRLNSTGVVESRKNAAYVTLETWLNTGTNSQYQSRATQTGSSGSPTITGTLNTWATLSAAQEWSIVPPALNTVASLTLLIEIRNASTLVVIDSATITLDSEHSSL